MEMYQGEDILGGGVTRGDELGEEVQGKEVLGGSTRVRCSMWEKA